VVWFIVIFCLKVAGQKRVGFLAGRLERPETRPGYKSGSDRTLSAIPEEEERNEAEVNNGGLSAPNEETEASLVTPLVISNTIFDEREYAREENKFHRKVIGVRAAFVISGICIIISGGLFYWKGVASFDDSLSTVRVGIDLVQSTAKNVINLTDSLLADQETLEQGIKDTRSRELDRQDICNSTDPLAAQINQFADDLSTQIKDLGVRLRDEVTRFGDDMRELIVLTQDIFFFMMVAISIVIIVIILAMLLGSFFAAKGISNCFTMFVTNVILWPMFTFFLILMWAFATLFLVGSIAGADFCIRPDDFVKEILKKYQNEFGSIIFGFLIYYISGCTVAPTGQEAIQETMNLIVTVVDSAHSLTNILKNETLIELENVCGMGKTAATALQSGASLVHDATHAVNDALIRVDDILSCRTFNPIYTTFVHDAFCVEGVDGLAWIFSSSLFISVFSMTMIMFRAALYPIKESSVAESMAL